MPDERKDQGNITVLRFVTPLLIVFFGFVSNSYLSSIDKKFEKIDTRIENFFDKFNNLDKRLDKLEWQVSDGNKGFAKEGKRE